MTFDDYNYSQYNDYVLIADPQNQYEKSAIVQERKRLQNMEVPSSEVQVKPAVAISAFTDERFADTIPLPDYAHKPITLGFTPADEIESQSSDAQSESNPKSNAESQLQNIDNE